MRNVTADTITEAVLQTIADTTEPRLRQIMTSLIRHLHAFAREVELTPDEWMTAMEFLVRVGETTQTDRNEFILASDTLGVSALVDLLHNRNSDGATTSSLLGPFYVNGERMQTLDVGGDLIGNNEGEPVVVAGRVTTPQGAPIAGACLEIWQNAANGMYESEDPEHGPGNLRCKMFTDDEGALPLHHHQAGGLHGAVRRTRRHDAAGARAARLAAGAHPFQDHRGGIPAPGDRTVRGGRRLHRHGRGVRGEGAVAG